MGLELEYGDIDFVSGIFAMPMDFIGLQQL